MAQIDNEAIKTHLRTLYAGQRDIWKALDAVGRSFRASLFHLKGSGVTIPSPLRESLGELNEILLEFQATEQFLELFALNESLLAPDTPQPGRTGFQTEVKP
jgi:transcriptional regulator with GAF, ATPase, and Fis domain